MPDCLNLFHVMAASNCINLGFNFDQQLKTVAIIVFICLLCYLLCKNILEHLMMAYTQQLLFSETIIQTKSASSHGLLFHSTILLSSGKMRFLEMLGILVNPSFPDPASIKEEKIHLNLSTPSQNVKRHLKGKFMYVK